MFAAGFVDAGLISPEELGALPGKLGLEGVTIQIESVIRATVIATRLSVKWEDNSWKKNFGHSGANEHDHPHTHENTNLLLGDDAAHNWHSHYTDIDALIETSSLDPKTVELARRIFRALAEAEAEAHGIEIEKVAFHEIGTIDSIVDIVMAAYC
jgi:uncharacterized protein (DUF111 family)